MNVSLLTLILYLTSSRKWRSVNYNQNWETFSDYKITRYYTIPKYIMQKKHFHFCRSSIYPAIISNCWHYYTSSDNQDKHIQVTVIVRNIENQIYFEIFLTDLFNRLLSASILFNCWQYSLMEIIGRVIKRKCNISIKMYCLGKGKLDAAFGFMNSW